MPKMIFSFLLVFVIIFSVYHVIINTPREIVLKFLKSLFPIFVTGVFVLMGFIIFVNLF
jgi:hypothetical protein